MKISFEILLVDLVNIYMYTIVAVCILCDYLNHFELDYLCDENVKKLMLEILFAWAVL